MIDLTPTIINAQVAFALTLAFFASLSLYFLLKKDYTKYILATILGLYTHYFMLLVLFTQILTLPLASDKKTRRLFLKGSLISLFFFIPWILFFLTQHKALLADSFWVIAPKIDMFFQIPGLLYNGYEKEFGYYDKFITPFSLFIALILLMFVLKVKDKTLRNKYWIISIWTLLPPIIVFLVSFIKPIFIPRYIIFSAVGLLLLLVLSLQKQSVVIRIVLFLIIITATVKYNSLQIKNKEKADIRKTIKEIKSLAKEGDFLYVTSELDFPTAKYYFGDNRVFIYDKTYEEIPDYVGKILIPRDRIVRSFPLFPQKAFVLRPDNHYDIQTTSDL